MVKQYKPLTIKHIALPDRKRLTDTQMLAVIRAIHAELKGAYPFDESIEIEVIATLRFIQNNSKLFVEDIEIPIQGQSVDVGEIEPSWLDDPDQQEFY